MVSYRLSPHSFERKGKERAVSLSTSNLKSSCTYEKVFFLLTKKQKIKATLATFLRGNLWLGNCEAWYGRRALQACSPTWSTGYKKKTIVNWTTWLWLFCVALYITFTTSVSQRHSEIIIIIITIIIIIIIIIIIK